MMVAVIIANATQATYVAKAEPNPLHSRNIRHSFLS